MKQKMTISELRTFIQEQALKLLAEHILEERKLQEDNSDIQRDLEMRMDSSTGKLSMSDLEDVAAEHGLNLDNSELLAISQAVMSAHATERDGELTDDIQYTLDSHFGGETPESFKDFYTIFSQLNFDNTYTPEEVKEKYLSMTTDPSQLALFEDKEGNLPYGTHLLNYAGIPNLLAGISNIQQDIKNSISEYEADTVAIGGTPEEAKQKKIESIQNIKQSISMLINDLQATSLKLDNGINYLNKK